VTGDLRIHLVRHGQSQWNAAGRIQGQTARVPLSCLGRRQAALVARHLTGERVDVLLTSDLFRAVQTADAISDSTARLPRRDRRLREQSYGRFEGQLRVDVAVGEADWRDRTLRIGGGESFQDVYVRVGSLLQTWIETAPLRGQSEIVLVTHGDTIRAALEWLGDISGELLSGSESVPPNGSATTVTLLAGRVMDCRMTVPGPDAPEPGTPEPSAGDPCDEFRLPAGSDSAKTSDGLRS
jgi:broad specificity phosphatase PhoE